MYQEDSGKNDRTGKEVVRLGYFIHRTVEKRQETPPRLHKSAQPEYREAFRLITRHGPIRAVAILGEEHEELVWRLIEARPEIFC